MKLLILTLLFSLQALAQDRISLIRWTEPTGNTDGTQMTEAQLSARTYRLYYGTASRDYSHAIVIEQSEAGENGSRFTEINLDITADTDVYMAMTCFYPAGTVQTTEQESVYSNEVVKVAFIRAPVIIIDGVSLFMPRQDLKFDELGRPALPEDIKDYFYERGVDESELEIEWICEGCV